ncbi:hypothetical protein SEA_EYES_44 [Gordonia phage Eyes]|nr:hypothetical protein SEA_EYES_44 [Gordonia phage Eyes]
MMPAEVADALAEAHPTLTGAALDELAQNVDRACAAHVLYELTGGREGFRPDGFRAALYVAMSKASPDHMARIVAAFPDESLAYSVAHFVKGGRDAIRAAARRG